MGIHITDESPMFSLTLKLIYTLVSYCPNIILLNIIFKFYNKTNEDDEIYTLLDEDKYGKNLIDKIVTIPLLRIDGYKF